MLCGAQGAHIVCQSCCNRPRSCIEPAEAAALIISCTVAPSNPGASAASGSSARRLGRNERQNEQAHSPVGAQRTGGVERRCGDQVWYGLPQALELLVARQVLYENVAVHIMLGPTRSGTMPRNRPSIL